MSTTTTSDRPNQLGRFQIGAIQRYPEAAAKLPEHPEEWYNRDVDLTVAQLEKFREAGVIQTVRVDYDRSTRPYVWKTYPGVPRYAKRWLENQERTPCDNATGIRCVESGEVYTCTDDECDCRMDRETAEEVVG